MTNAMAVVLELPSVPDVEFAFTRLALRDHCLFLDSARNDTALGRYSFLAVDPFDYLEVSSDGSDGLARLASRMERFTAETIKGLPPFQGGAAGLFSYDLSRSLERIARPEFDEFHPPALAVGLYDVVLAIDHQEQRAWVISQGFPEVERIARRRRARERLDGFLRYLEVPAALPQRPETEDLDLADLAPQYSVAVDPRLMSSFSSDGYLAAVERVVNYIRAGDVFQVNLAQRLLTPATVDATTLYLRLRRRNPAPFAGYFDLGELQIVSASPERFLQLRDREVEARPIKGTRPRTALPEADLFAADELLQSGKDRAENVMIVDLLRNDLSRVCHPESIRVTQLCHVEVYQYVQHLVSAVRGRLDNGNSPIDLLRASFPGGSITGAPKVRAMEIIAELEPTARGPYCGSLGYLGFDGALDLSILIRTITSGRGWLQFPVGGGIVAQSDPVKEYEETWHKAKGLIEALQPAQ
jgi:para-aminobenzoate synthetase component 1